MVLGDDQEQIRALALFDLLLLRWGIQFPDTYIRVYVTFFDVVFAFGVSIYHCTIYHRLLVDFYLHARLALQLCTCPFVFFADMLVTMSTRYETGSPFNTGAGGGTADYVFALMFAMAMMLLTYPLVVTVFPIPPFFVNNMVYFVMYVWSKRNPTAQAAIWGIPMEAIWLPFAYLALTVLMGNPYFDLLHGLAIGHLYYFLVDVFPQVYGKDILVTPHFLIDRFGVGEYRPDRPLRDPADARPATQAAGAAGGGHAWGAGGQQLGRQ